MRVLVVEDEPLVRLLLVETLADDGFEVIEAPSGGAACKLIEAPDHVDLVVTDLNMPDADGVKVATCAREFSPTVRILFISGRSDLLAGLPIPLPYSYLRKPFSMTQFSKAVETLLGRP
jgi:two-component system cell cycle sensor histidine kinase/response regulator CckA